MPLIPSPLRVMRVSKPIPLSSIVSVMQTAAQAHIDPRCAGVACDVVQSFLGDAVEVFDDGRGQEPVVALRVEIDE